MADKTRGLLKGPKFNGRHTTLIDAAIPLVALLRDDPRVTKIIIGVITSRRGNTNVVKAQKIDAGLRITVAAPRYVQQLFAYTRDPDGVRQSLCAARDIPVSDC
jgi:hypothetical protein